MIIKSAFGPQVLEDLKTSFLQKKNCDVIIYVGEEPNVEVVYAHSFILRMRSSYFDSALSPTWAEMKDGKFIFKKPNISKLVLQKILLQVFLFIKFIDRYIIILYIYIYMLKNLTFFFFYFL